MRFLITGSAGFIGFHIAFKLLQSGHNVIGVDNFSPYYDPRLKEDRNRHLEVYPSFSLYRMSLQDSESVASLFSSQDVDCVIHLAAQAGVRHSFKDPMAYIDSNILGSFSLLEAMRSAQIKHFIYASTSSVYGNSSLPTSTEVDSSDYPLSLYAATKKSGELMAHAYSHLWELPTTIVRFFSVYGPWGRPDMALFRFTESILRGEPIEVYNHGQLARDFTYVGDLVHAIVKLIDYPPSLPSVSDQSLDVEKQISSSRTTPFRVVNIGSNRPVGLMEFIAAIEEVTQKKAVCIWKDMQPGDVHRTCAAVDVMRNLIGYTPDTELLEGVACFVHWYRNYYIEGRACV